MQRAMSTRRDRKNDVPFGVRAIESGIEVDGVWISRGNTPVPGSPVSLATQPSPPKAQRKDWQSPTLSSTSSIPDLSMPQPAHPISKPTSGRNTGASTRSNSPDSRLQRSRGSSIERLSPMRGLSPQPSGDFASHARQSYRPRQSSHLRYSSADVSDSSDEYVVTDHNVPPRHHLQSEDNPFHNAFLVSADLPAAVRIGFDTSLSPEPIAGHYMPTKPSPTKARGYKSRVVPRTVSSTSVSPTQGHDGQFSFEQVPLSNLATPTSAQNDPFLTPHESPIEEQKDYFNGLPSFHNFVETDPRNGQRQNFINSNSSEDYENSYLDHADARTPNTRDTDVIRKVNSGFEILRPGTLGSKTSDTPETYQPTRGDGDKRQSRRLQKRVRSSTSASRKSMFSEDVV